MKTKFNILILAASLTCMSWCAVADAQTIEAGGWHSLVVCSDSTVKAFGENATGELGDGTTTDSNVPVTAIGLSSIVSVSCGGDQLEAHSLALKSDGTVWSWGSNIYGGLGNGTTTNTMVPGQVLVMTGAIAISAGGWHSAALKSDSTVWSWGWNTDGQIGDGTTTDRVVPVIVPGLTGVKAISAGTYHTLALKSDGTVWAWGDNVSGQIGDGSTTDRTSPVQVSGLTNVVSISGGRFFSLAVKSDGTVWAWGENLYGQLGDGSTTDRHTPVQVSGLTGIIPESISAGAFHCMVAKTDSTLWSWGRNTYGNLSDGTTVNRSTPVLVSGGTTGGTNFTLLYKSDGTFWGCGRNLSGQLGDGTFLQRNTLVQSTGVCSIMQPVGIPTFDPSYSNSITAYPNPSSTGIFTIELQNENGQLAGGTIEVYNMLGEIAYQSAIDLQTGNANMTVDLSNQPNGIYFLAVTAGGHTSYQKLVKH